MHALNDEYIPEIQEIYKYICDNNMIIIEELSKVIDNVYCNWFGNDVYYSNTKECEKIAKKYILI